MIAGMDLFKYYITLVSFLGFLQNRGNAQQVYMNRKPTYYLICNKLYQHTIILNIGITYQIPIMYLISVLRILIMRINLYNLLTSLSVKQLSINGFFFVCYLQITFLQSQYFAHLNIWQNIIYQVKDIFLLMSKTSTETKQFNIEIKCNISLI